MTQAFKLSIVIAVLALAACGKSADSASAAPAAPPPEDPQTARLRALHEAAERVKAEREARRDELRTAGTATLTDKKLVGGKDDKKLELEFEFKNTSSKTLTMAEGTIVLLDASGAALRKLKIPFQNEIAPGKSDKKRGKFPLDKASDGDHKLVDTPLEQ